MSICDPKYTTGVYLITNTVTGAVYVGSTAQGFHQRWTGHKCALKRNTHPNRYLQRAWNKYGQHAFTFTVAEYVSDLETLLAREQAWIDQYFTLGADHCYNLTPTAGSQRGRQVTDEQRRKMSVFQKGRKKPASFVEAVSKTYAGFVGPDGTIYAPIVNLCAFCREHGLHDGHMQEVATGKRRTFNGWRLIGTEPPKEYYFSFIAPDGTRHTTTGLNEFCRAHGLQQSCMSNLYHGKRLSHKGWRKG